MNLDDWQKEVLKTKGNICLRSGRQVGKSTIISIKAAEYALKNPKKVILVVSAVERQAYLLFEKILGYIMNKYPTLIMTGKYRPTKTLIRLKNGSKIYCLPTGMTGYSIRGFTINLLIADEAAFIPEEVWTAVTPMLAITKGNIWLLSTPHGKEGYYYDCFNDPNFKQFHISSEECPRRDDKFLAREKERLTKVQYAQEYLGEFVDELIQFFPSDLIKKCMTEKEHNPQPDNSKYLGVDIARMGGDESVLASVERTGAGFLRMFSMDISRNSRLTETTKRILLSDQRYNYERIYIDDGGLGVGVFDQLLQEEQTRRKIEAINNSARPLNRDESKRKKILKEDLYANLLRLMEQGKISLLDDENLFLSLKSIQYEYTDDKRLKIFGKYSHIAEAIIRAAWCLKSKSLSIWVR